MLRFRNSGNVLLGLEVENEGARKIAVLHISKTECWNWLHEWPREVFEYSDKGIMMLLFDTYIVEGL